MLVARREYIQSDGSSVHLEMLLLDKIDDCGQKKVAINASLSGELISILDSQGVFQRGDSLNVFLIELSEVERAIEAAHLTLDWACDPSVGLGLPKMIPYWGPRLYMECCELVLKKSDQLGRLSGARSRSLDTKSGDDFSESRSNERVLSAKYKFVQGDIELSIYRPYFIPSIGWFCKIDFGGSYSIAGLDLVNETPCGLDSLDAIVSRIALSSTLIQTMVLGGYEWVDPFERISRFYPFDLEPKKRAKVISYINKLCDERVDEHLRKHHPKTLPEVDHLL